MTRTTLFLSSLLSLALVGCTADNGGDTQTDPSTTVGTYDETSTVKGSVSDSSGTQPVSLAGEGTVAAATTVQVWTTTPGDEQLIGEADIAADATYAVEVAADMADCRVVALDADGAVIGSVLLPMTPPEDGEATAAPITSETSLEAEVYLAARVELGSSSSEADSVSMTEIMARIGADVAAEAQRWSDSQGDADGAVDAMADAMLTVQATQAAWADAEGIVISHAEHDEAMLEATQDLYAALHAEATGGSSADAELDAWADAWAGSWSDQGLDLTLQSELEAVVGVAHRATLVHALSADDSAQAFIEASLMATGRLEARLTGASVESLLATALGSSTDASLFADAGDELEDEAEDAQTVGELQAAFDAYAESLVTSDLTSASALELMLDLNGVIDDAAVLGACEGYAAELETDVWAAIDAQARLSDRVNAGSIASATADAWTDFESNVYSELESTGTLVDGAELDAASAVMVEATGSFRGAYTGQW